MSQILNKYKIIHVTSDTAAIDELCVMRNCYFKNLIIMLLLFEYYSLIPKIVAKLFGCGIV